MRTPPFILQHEASRSQWFRRFRLNPPVWLLKRTKLALADFRTTNPGRLRVAPTVISAESTHCACIHQVSINCDPGSVFGHV